MLGGYAPANLLDLCITPAWPSFPPTWPKSYPYMTTYGSPKSRYKHIYTSPYTTARTAQGRNNWQLVASSRGRFLREIIHEEQNNYLKSNIWLWVIIPKHTNLCKLENQKQEEIRLLYVGGMWWVLREQQWRHSAFILQQRADSNRHTATANSTDGHPAAWSVKAGISSPWQHVDLCWKFACPGIDRSQDRTAAARQHEVDNTYQEMDLPRKIYIIMESTICPRCRSFARGWIFVTVKKTAVVTRGQVQLPLCCRYP